MNICIDTLQCIETPCLETLSTSLLSLSSVCLKGSKASRSRAQPGLQGTVSFCSRSSCPSPTLSTAAVSLTSSKHFYQFYRILRDISVKFSSTEVLTPDFSCSWPRHRSAVDTVAVSVPSFLCTYPLPLPLLSCLLWVGVVLGNGSLPFRAVPIQRRCDACVLVSEP